MLDIEIVTAPTDTALDIVSVSDLATHLRLSPTLRNNAYWQTNMQAAIEEAVDDLHGLSGSLNRMVLPCTIKRYLNDFPSSDEPIRLPFPDLISVDAVTIEDGSSPPNELATSTYTVVGNTLIPEIYAVDEWPDVTEAPRAISVTYKAGYSSYPSKLKRLVKILAAHFMENPEGSINEPRQMQINRKVEFGVENLRTSLRVPVSYDNWE